MEFIRVFCRYCFIFFFFKQKTAYEMRISDWSSDVCSSDLSRRMKTCRPSRRPRRLNCALSRSRACACPSAMCARPPGRSMPWPIASSAWARSEEHTSELQSLMRISYAVFCLKKKKQVIKDIICLQPFKEGDLCLVRLKEELLLLLMLSLFLTH